MKGEIMKVRNVAMASMLAMMLVGGGVATQLATLTPVYADELPVTNAQIAGDLVEGTAEKEEVVYASMTAEGVVKDLYVVNELFAAVPTMVRDFGAYSEATNLTDESAIGHESDSVVCVIEEESFVYQGHLASTTLPWNVRITYELDGQQIAPADLAGKSGALRISIETTADAALDTVYFDNYMLQITCALPIERATHIATDDGSIALSGSDTTVAFTGMPGKSGSFSLTADVKDFEMEGMQIAAIPFSMMLDMPDSSAMIAQFDQLIEGTRQLEEGADQLEQGSSALAEGVQAFGQGATQLRSGAAELSSGVAAYVAGVARVSEGLAQAAAGSKTFAAQLDRLSQASEGMAGSLDATEAQVSEMVAQIQASSLPDAEKAALLQRIAGLSAQLGGLKEYVAGVGALSGGYAQIDSSLEQLSAGLAELSAQGEQLASGSDELQAGTDELSSATDALAQGADQLSEGTAELAQGTAQLHEESQRIPEKVRAEIDALMADYDKSDFEPRSFVDSRNTNVKLVQFVMATEAIHVPDPEPEQTVEEEETLLSRFFALFS